VGRYTEDSGKGGVVENPKPVSHHSLEIADSDSHYSTVTATPPSLANRKKSRRVA
jgi:hypothetical protein